MCLQHTVREYCMWHTPLSCWNSPPIMFNLPCAAKQMLVWKLYSRLMKWQRCLVTHAEDYYVHLDPFRSIYAFRSEHILFGWSFWVTVWTQTISVIFHISFFMLHSHYCQATVILSVEMCSKSLGPNFCYIMFISTGGLKDFQSSLNILSAPPYRNMHRGLITLHFVITLQRIWLWNQLFFSSNMAEQEVLEQREESKEERGNVWD